ncbi:MAG: hypothetical protein ABIC95_04735 [archaeon]
MKRKSAAISIQFNWIFVLIVGGLILGGVIWIVNTHKESARTSVDREIRAKLQTILTTGQQSATTTYSIKIPKVELYFSCDGFAVGKEQINPVRFKPAFSQDTIETKWSRILVFSGDISRPFRIGSALYVTPPDRRYILLRNNDPIDEDSHKYLLQLYASATHVSLPDNVTKEVADSCTILDVKGHPQVQIAFFDNGDPGTLSKLQECANKFSEMDDDKVTAVGIHLHQGGLDGSGWLTFYEKRDDQFVPAPGAEQATYLGRELILGAIISSNRETYLCGLEDMLDRFQLVSEFQELRTAQLIVDHPDDRCNAYYDEAFTDLEGLNNVLEMDDRAGPINRMQLTQVENIRVYAQNIEAHNRRLELRRGIDCALLY